MDVRSGRNLAFDNERTGSRDGLNTQNRWHGLQQAVHCHRFCFSLALQRAFAAALINISYAHLI